MAFYQNKGLTPHKRHTVFKYKNKLCYEELVSREGFSSMYSNLYHLHMPTSISKVGDFKKCKLNIEATKHQTRHLQTVKIESSGNAIDSRIPLFFNDDIIINIAHISQKMDFHYRNGHFDELFYVQYGKGVLSTNYGDLSYKKGDYVVIPRGVIWKFDPEKKTKLLIVESLYPIETPAKYRNKFVFQSYFLSTFYK